MTIKKIWIDCDPGHDDALAIFTAFAFPEKIEIIGVSTIGGNQTLEKVTTNAQHILGLLQSKFPLAKGEEGPLIKMLTTGADAHGDSGMDGPDISSYSYPLSDKSGVLAMYEGIMKEKKVSLVGIGPLTNIALLLKTFPEVKERIEEIVIMGGGLSHGNVTALAEFNIYVDPDAAHIVFHSGIPLVMAGLDVTEKAVITIEEINSLKGKGKISNIVYQLLHFYNESGKQFGFVDSPLHDLCTIVYLLDGDIFKGETKIIDIITQVGPACGLTYSDNRLIPKGHKNTKVLLDVNREAFIDVLKTALSRLDNLY